LGRAVIPTVEIRFIGICHSSGLDDFTHVADSERGSQVVSDRTPKDSRSSCALSVGGVL